MHTLLICFTKFNGSSFYLPIKVINKSCSSLMVGINFKPNKIVSNILKSKLPLYPIFSALSIGILFLYTNNSPDELQSSNSTVAFLCLYSFNTYTHREETMEFYKSLLFFFLSSFLFLSYAVLVTCTFHNTPPLKCSPSNGTKSMRFLR